jgi:NAD(P)-dependent dehydrogenase (short-subunit alcohol dehydrogenase family)
MAAMAVICITGSSDGIGLATARVLVADGHRVLIHARSRDRGRPTADGLETTFAVNVLAPHLLTSLLAAELKGRLLWLGSGSANFGRPDPATLGGPQEPSQA